MNPFTHRSFRLLRGLLPGLLLVVACIPPVYADELMRSVQEELRKRNLYFGDVNGLNSPQVAAALRRYQQRKGFQPTGEPDGVTLRSLSLAGPAADGWTVYITARTSLYAVTVPVGPATRP